jgi:predicted N-acyltransferase
VKNNENDYVIRLLKSPLDVVSTQWNALLTAQAGGGAVSPFMRHEYLAALHESGSATPEAGWTPRFVTLWHGDTLAGACALYLKTHSYGEYVFDHAWANAYHQHGLSYYPKALVAVPFTPVPGARLLARTASERLLLVQGLVSWCGEENLSSLHLLFANDDDIAACKEAGLMLRHTVQFHWSNQKTVDATANDTSASKFASFDEFLMSLSQEKRKKIKQERRKVSDAGITFRWSRGTDITDDDWDFFYRCYERTYYEHGNAPYLSRDFFARMQRTMPDNWLMFVAEHTAADGSKQAIATSLIAISTVFDWVSAPKDPNSVEFTSLDAPDMTAYGRYWGALARVDCLHFEACYYQPLAWCIDHGFNTFEGGAQGEHKMARALMPVKTTSAHWLAHPSFADAVERFLEREGEGINHYVDDLAQRSPFKAGIQT